MTRLIALVLVLLMPNAGSAKEQRIPVSVSRTGDDQVGSLFVAALNQELSQSSNYRPAHIGEINRGLTFYIDLITVDTAETENERGKRSVASIVIQDFGRPNSFPVADMWYHKVVTIDKNSVARVAKDVLDDMDARWCNYTRNAVRGCPKEKFDPRL